jgi:nicotinamide-nucleotide amidase
MTQQAVNLVELLKANGRTCATAESCTGGMIGSLVTAVPGSSEV